MEAFVSKLSGFLWGNYMIILCLGVGIFLMVRVVIQNFSKTIVVQFVFKVIG